MTIPDITVEVAFDSGYLTAAVDRTWTDVTDYVEADKRIDIQRGRQNEFGEVSPSTLSLTFDNSDGRFTPENAAGAYYPNVKKGRPIRVSVPSSGNLLDSTAATVDTAPGVALWSSQGSSPPVRSSSATQVFEGSNAMQVQFTGGGGTPYVRTPVTGLSIGSTYTVSAYTHSGSAGLFAQVGIEGIGTAAAVTTLSTFVRSSFTFTATGTSHNVMVSVSSGSVAGFLWVDAIQVESGSTATDFTTDPPGTLDLFTGYIDEIPVEWPGGTDATATSRISATSRMARLGRGLEFRSIVEEEILDDSPVLYWPLGEPSGATEAGNIAPGRSERLVVTQVGSGGTLEFGAGTGPGTDDLTAPVFTPVDASNGLCLTMPFADVLQPGDKNVWFELWFVAAPDCATNEALMVLSDNGGTIQMHLMIEPAAGGGSVIGGVAINGIYDTNATAAGVRDGALHHLRWTFSLQDAGTFSSTFKLDGGANTSGPNGSWPFVSGGAAFFPALPNLALGGDGGISISASLVGRSRVFAGTIAHFALYRTSPFPAEARFVEHYLAGTTGFAGESSDARIERYARLAGIPTAEVSTETGLSTSISHRDTTGQTALSLMQDVATTEDGVLFDGRDGVLTFHARSHRYGSTSSFTLDCTDGDVEADLSPVLDDQGMSNDVTASREGGAKIRSVNQDSIDENGYYRDTVELMTTDDNEVQSRAGWQVNRFGTPRVKLTSVSAELAACSASQQALLLAADIGTRFTLDNLPSQASATSMDFFIEGISYDIGAEEFTVSFNTSAADYSNVWQLDSATASQLDSTTVLAY